MDTKNFSDKYIKINSSMINLFFTNVMDKDNYDFESVFHSDKTIISKLELSLISLIEGFENLFENSMLANASLTIDFTEVYEFGFIEDSLPFKNHSEQLLKNVTTFYNVWLSEKNIASITNLTPTSYVNNCIESKCTEYVFLLFLILFQSCLMQIGCYFTFKIENKIKKLYTEIIKFKSLVTKGKKSFELDLEEFRNKQIKLFSKSITIVNSNFNW
ncbi:hypothetical protein [Spiroplasma endosymbiont of Aspidapion aeneum]|uniref:hypothetical protein n=1 Tax=Spiroplasma endosymbiont of Aspidapion aeneum TaxID=3066276 RepID=UPI00313BAB01